MQQKQQGQQKQTLNVVPISRDYSSLELVDGLQRNDKQVAAAFFDRYAPQVNHLVRKFMGPDDEHEDLVNTVFAEMLKSIGRIKEPQTLTRWVSMVSVNVVRLELRRRKYKRMFFDVKAEPAAHVSAVTGTQDLMTQLYKVINGLNENEQIVFVLHYLEGNTYDEIAQLLSMSVATAKRRGKRAKEKFQRRVTENARLRKLVEELSHE